MLSESEIKNALARDETVFSNGRKITSVEEIVKPSMPPATESDGKEIGWLASELAQVKQNQSDVTKLSSVQTLLTSYDKQIEGISSNTSINDLTVKSTGINLSGSIKIQLQIIYLG